MIQRGPARQRSTNQRLSDDRPPRTGGVQPGKEERTTIDDRSRLDQVDRDAMVTSKERKVAKSIVPFVLVAMIIATLVLAFFTRRWEFLLALLVFVPYLFLISAPVWLASSSKVAQNEDAREHRRVTANPPKGPTDLPDPRGPKEPD